MKEIVKTDLAPAAIGPYSQATAHNGLVFVSGQLPLDPVSGELCQGDVAEQTELVMKNLESIVKAAGSSLANVLKTTIYLADIGDFATVNEVYGRFFPENPPARAAYQVAALPRGARVEIEAVCAK